MSAAKPVFISYATATAREAAIALERALGPELVFRDETQLQHGQSFPDQIFEALIDAQVIVCLIDQAYLDSWFCLAELRVATETVREQDLAQSAVAGLVFAAARGSKDMVFAELPPALRLVQWPELEDTAALTRLVRQQLASADLQTRRMDLGDSAVGRLRHWLRNEAAMWPRRPFPDSTLLANLPPMPEGRFFGRARTLNELHRRLLGSRAPGSCAIVAPGGGGKSRLAQEYLWRYGPRCYPGGVIWIDAASGAHATQQLHVILRQLIPDCPDPGAMERAGIDLRQRLGEKLRERASFGPLLWVIDNVPEPAPGEKPRPLSDWTVDLPGQRALLATSRIRQHPAELNLILPPMERAAAIALLQSELTDEELPPEEADAIAERVGDWPLALELLHASFRDRAMTPAEFLLTSREGSIAETLDAAMEILAEQVPEGALRGISETLLFSVRRLSPEAQTLACVLGWCTPMEPIPQALVTALGPEVASPVARSALLTRSVVAPDAGGAYGHLHPLVADFLRQRDADRQGLRRMAHALASALAALAPESSADWPRANLLTMHSDVLQNAAATAEPGILEGCLRVSQIWNAQARHREAYAFAAACIAACDPAGTSVLEEAIALGVPLAQAALGHDAVVEALEISEGTLRRLQQRRETLGERWGQAVACYATALVNAEQYERAELELRQLAPELATLLGTRHECWLIAQNALALAISYQGRGYEAVGMLEDVLETAGATLGSQHAFTLQAMGDLSAQYLRLSRFAEALALRERAFAAMRAGYGPNHTRTLWLQEMLAGSFAQAERIDEALALIEDVIAREIQVFGPRHPITLFAQATRINILAAGNRLTEALLGAEELLDVFEAERERVPPRYYLTAVEYVGTTCLETGEWERARAVYERFFLLVSPPERYGRMRTAAAICYWGVLRLLHREREAAEVFTREIAWLEDPQAIAEGVVTPDLVQRLEDIRELIAQHTSRAQ